MKHTHDISAIRRRRLQDAVVCPQLFAEIVETITTTDRKFEDPDGSWGSRPSRPPGRGWRVADYSHDKRTSWTRRTPVLWPVRPSPGGWRRR